MSRLSSAQNDPEVAGQLWLGVVELLLLPGALGQVGLAQWDCRLYQARATSSSLASMFRPNVGLLK